MELSQAFRLVCVCVCEFHLYGSIDERRHREVRPALDDAPLEASDTMRMRVIALMAALRSAHSQQCPANERVAELDHFAGPRGACAYRGPRVCRR